MRFLFCSHDGRNAFGGPLEWLKRLGPALRDRGHDVRFAFLTEASGDKCSTIAGLRRLGFECHWRCQQSVLQYRDHTEARVRWFIQQAQKIAPDIFVANHLLAANYAGRWIRAAGIPSVAVIHSDDPYYQGMYEAFGAESGPFAPSAFVCVSESLANSSRARAAAGTIVERISCGAPVPPFRAAPAGQGPFRIAYVGKFTEAPKRISDVTRALCRASREVPGVEAVLFGGGRDISRVSAILQNEGYGTEVTLGGLIPSIDVQRVLQRFHAIVLLSDFEGMPMSILEGMGCGVVPVCLAVRSGIPEIVRDQETGLLVHDRNDAFVAAIRRLRDDERLWLRLSENARRLVESEYSTDVVANQWIALANRLMQREEGGTRPVRIPRRTELPPVPSRLASEDRRKPPFGVYVREQVRRVRRRLNSAQ